MYGLFSGFGAVGANHHKKLLAGLFQSFTFVMSWPEQFKVLIEREFTQIVLCGPSGSGKSFWTRTIAKKLGYRLITLGCLAELDATELKERARSLMDFSGVVCDGGHKVESQKTIVVEDGADAWTTEDHRGLEKVFKASSIKLVWVIHAWNMYSTNVLKEIQRGKSWFVLNVPPYGIKMLKSIAPSVPDDLVPRANGSAWAILRFQNDVLAGRVESARDFVYGPTESLKKVLDTPSAKLMDHIEDEDITKFLLRLNFVDYTTKLTGCMKMATVLSDTDLYDTYHMGSFSLECLMRSVHLHGKKPLGRINHWKYEPPIPSKFALVKRTTRDTLDCPKTLTWSSLKDRLEFQDTTLDTFEVVRPSSRKRPAEKALIAKAKDGLEFSRERVLGGRGADHSVKRARGAGLDL